MSELDSTVGVVALAGVGLALVSLCAALYLGLRLRRLRGAQRAVLGEVGERDLVEHATELGVRFGNLARETAAIAARLEERLAAAEHRLDGSVSHCAVVRYDAYDDMTGRQSSSVALLDDHHSGVVFSSILHRDQSRLYAKPLVGGRSEFDLSPEEQQAVAAALGGDSGAGKAL